jgi:hypothetical protein
MAGSDNRNREAEAVRRGRMMEERAASQAIFRSGAAGRTASRKSSSGSEFITALVVIAVVIGTLVLVFNFAK